MIDFKDINATLEMYSNAFNHYIEQKEMPSSIPCKDSLAQYMREVIDENLVDGNSDPAWTEALKDALMAYFAILLEHFKELRREAKRELSAIARFKEASDEQKQKMWQQVCEIIKANYSEYEVNITGYSAQLQSAEVDNEAVYDAIIRDWESACRERLSQKEGRILARAKRQFNQKWHETGTKDYEDKKRIDYFMQEYPQLKEIVDKIGRDKEPSNDDKDSIIFKFLPITVAKNTAVEEFDRVELGNNLERLLPIELSMPDDLFFKRYVTKELQQLSSPGRDKPQKIEDYRHEPRLTKGPIIVSVDTSASMTGLPLQIAVSLLKQLLRMAKKQKRSCYLITFSVRAKAIDLAKPCNWSKLDSFLSDSYGGGTDGEQMLTEAVNILQTDTYEMADVLIISDFEFSPPKAHIVTKIEKEKTLGTRFYGLKIGISNHKYHQIMDKIWTI